MQYNNELNVADISKQNTTNKDNKTDTIYCICGCWKKQV
jgi:hypothetical protein